MNTNTTTPVPVSVHSVESGISANAEITLRSEHVIEWFDDLIRNGEEWHEDGARRVRAVVAELMGSAQGVKFDIYELNTPELRAAFEGKTRIAVVHIDSLKPLRAALLRCGGGK